MILMVYKGIIMIFGDYLRADFLIGRPALIVIIFAKSPEERDGWILVLEMIIGIIICRCISFVLNFLLYESGNPNSSTF
jgi:hypothetical protein